MKIVAVIPAYNESSRIGETVAGVLKFTPDIIVVDDGSRDETGDRAREAGATVLRHRINRGQGAALKTGTVAALRCGADLIVHLDADGQHDPSCLPDMIRPIQDGVAEVVFGSRFLGVASDGMPLVRRALLHVARVFNRYALGIPHTVTDPQSGLRVLRAEAAHAIDFCQDGMAHCSEILRLVTRSPFRWQEVPVKVHYTPESLAKGQKASHALKIAWQLFLGSFRQ